jgi:hypothetical protein
MTIMVLTQGGGQAKRMRTATDVRVAVLNRHDSLATQ